MSSFPTTESKIVLSAAQLLSLNTSPVLLVPGKTGCLIELMSAYFRYVHGATPFNPGVSDQLTLIYGPILSSNPTVNLTPATGFVDQSVDMANWLSPSWGGNGQPSTGVSQGFPLSSYIGQGISILQFDAGDTFPTGTNWTQGTGSVVVFLKYAYVNVEG